MPASRREDRETSRVACLVLQRIPRAASPGLLESKAFLEIFLRLYKINVIFLQNSMEAGIFKDLFFIGEIIKDA